MDRFTPMPYHNRSTSTQHPQHNAAHQPARTKSSWQPVSSWYTKSVGDAGHYYHQHVVLPALDRILHLTPTSSLLDIACGQGVLERHLPASLSYTGIDVAPSLIEYAKRNAKNPRHTFLVSDATRSIPIPPNTFTHATIVLALQNMEDSASTLKNAARALKISGQLVIVLNHPMFRIPRQTSWGIDEQNKMQYRRVDRYMSPLNIPITVAPSQGQKSQVTWTYHKPLSLYVAELRNAGFVITMIEELGSDKVSEGKASKMENRSRAEFPLFMVIVAQRQE